MNVTINDIARATGLSTATISKYINHKKIREENRILIEKAIQELGYTPNRNAQLLRCLLYTSPSPRDVEESRMPSSA